MFTVEKVNGTVFSFFKNSCIILILGLAMNIASYGIFKTPSAISYASLICMAVWYLLEGVTLGKRIGVSTYKEFIYILLISSGFLTVVDLISDTLYGGLIFGAFLIALTLIMYLPLIRDTVKSLICKTDKAI